MKKVKLNTIINAMCITALMVISYRLTFTINNYLDIIAADELSYLKFGKNIFVETRFDWGFLYNLWYKFLSLFKYNTVDLYYFNYKVLISIIPVLLFICLLVYEINTVIAFVISYLYLISKLHIATWPFVSGFCIILLLCFFILIRPIKDIGWKSVVLSFFSLLLYLVRPEYIVAFIIALCYSVYINKSNKKRWVLLLIMILFLVYVGDKTTKVADFDRGLFAYVQHYFITYKIWNKGVSLDIYQYIELAPKIFGKSYTLLGSLIYNPLEAIKHIITCVGFYTFTFLKSTEDLLLPSIWLQPLGKIRHLLFFCIVLVSIFAYRKYKIRNSIKDDRFLLFSIVVFFIAAAISNFLIGYNLHYFQLHFILFILLFSKLFFSKFTINANHWLFISLCIISTVFVPDIRKYPFQIVDYRESKNLPVQKLATILNDLNDNKKHCLLAYQTNIHFIVEGNNFSGIDVFSITKPFIQFINEKKVDFIYINEQLEKDERLNKDKEWKLFISNPGNYNFEKIEIKNSKNYLLIKS